MKLVSSQQVLYCALITLVIFCLLPGVSTLSRGGRSSRSSRSSRSTRSARYSSYSPSRYSSYSPSRYTSYGYTSYTRYYSYSTYRTYYLSYSTIRYYRPIYTGYYYYYYYFYYYYSPGYYLSSPSDASGHTVCENLVANTNGTNIGYFICPMDFEPSTFTACCGDSEAQYCCEPSGSSSTIAGAVVGSIIGIILLITIPIAIWRCCCYVGAVGGYGGYGGQTVVVEQQETVIATTSTQPAYVGGPPSMGYNNGYNGYNGNGYNGNGYQQTPMSAPPPYSTPKADPNQSAMYGMHNPAYNSNY